MRMNCRRTFATESKESAEIPPPPPEDPKTTKMRGWIIIGGVFFMIYVLVEQFEARDKILKEQKERKEQEEREAQEKMIGN